MNINPVEDKYVEAGPGRKSGRYAMNLLKLAVALCVVIAPLAGCTTPTPLFPPDMAPYAPEKLKEGDVLAISFPGSQTLNTTATIRPDGKITMPLVGEVAAAGLTPTELEKELLKLYDKQLVTKQVTVTVQSAAYPVFVTGAVVKPGKVMVDRPISDLEAIMEAGGFDATKADMRHVVIVRKDGDQLKRYRRNLKEVLEKKGRLFYLRPNDIVYVPEKLF